MNLRPAWSTKQVTGQLKLQAKPCLKRKKKREERRKGKRKIKVRKKIVEDNNRINLSW